MENAKPAELAVKELRDEVVKNINASGLPPFVVELVLANIINEVGELVKRQYENAVRDYNAEQNNGGEKT